MKRYAASALLLILVLAAAPCQAQFLKKLEQEFLGQGQQQGLTPGQPTMVGNANLPPGQYMMTNVQTGQAFYITIQNGQIYLTGQAVNQPGQGFVQQQQQQQQQPPSGLGGMIKGGLGSFLKNELTPQQAPVQTPQF